MNISKFVFVKSAHSQECLTSCKNIKNPTGDGRHYLNSLGSAFYGFLLNQSPLMVQVSVPSDGLSCQLNVGVQVVLRDIKTSSDACSDNKRGGRTKSRRSEDLTETTVKVVKSSNLNLGVRGAYSVLTSLL